MANQADFLVKNVFNEKSIRVERKPTPELVDLEQNLEPTEQTVISVQSTDVTLVIYAPEGMDLKYCALKVDAAVDLEVIAYRTYSYWTVRIVPNTLPPETPLNVNVNVGDPEGD